ncbi:hypothetical protein COO20_04275 [Thalassospira marina]|uniref:Uncharacterized protein n=2 Tax=Thalassospira marina TaxID=2048283 RepID=A0A2N3KY08_9PROT|nr:hypothetical protein COO20_04275 [Thalassospira marina]
MGFDWAADFLDFQQVFDVYVAGFPQYGPHEKAVADYQENAGAVWAGNTGTKPGEPLFLVGNSVLILLDGHQRLTPEQKKVRKGLAAKWKMLRASVHAANREAIEGPSLWSGVAKIE